MNPYRKFPMLLRKKTAAPDIKMSDCHLTAAKNLEAELKIHTDCGSPDFVIEELKLSVALARDAYRAASLRESTTAS